MADLMMRWEDRYAERPDLSTSHCGNGQFYFTDHRIATSDKYNASYCVQREGEPRGPNNIIVVLQNRNTFLVPRRGIHYTQYASEERGGIYIRDSQSASQEYKANKKFERRE